MSEITPNTPNPVREDAYVEELSEKLGIDPQYIPKSPVWRNEEEIKAIAEMFANMSGGGGSSGGGVLVVHETVSGDTHTLDKTWKQIADAVDSGGLPYVVMINEMDGNIIKNVHIVDSVANGSGLYIVGLDGNGYATADENGYPSYTAEDGAH